MASFFGLIVAMAVLPLAFGLGLLLRAPGTLRATGKDSVAANTLLCALAFNLVFLWQEIWLVLPKALIPGLHPILYHNDHGWTGAYARVELLQGTGALGTLALGLICALLLAHGSRLSPIWWLFLFWMTAQGLFQSLTQFAIGAVLPGNDVGRALAWIGLRDMAKGLILLLALFGMADTGRFLAMQAVDGGQPRALLWRVLLPALLAVPVILPFRMPRDWIEVGLIPLIICMAAAGWTVFMGGLLPLRGQGSWPAVRVGATVPALALAALLLLFQIVLRPGIPF